MRYLTLVLVLFLAGCATSLRPECVANMNAQWDEIDRLGGNLAEIEARKEAAYRRASQAPEEAAHEVVRYGALARRIKSDGSRESSLRLCREVPPPADPAFQYIITMP